MAVGVTVGVGVTVAVGEGEGLGFGGCFLPLWALDDESKTKVSSAVAIINNLDMRQGSVAAGFTLTASISRPFWLRTPHSKRINPASRHAAHLVGFLQRCGLLKLPA